MMPFDRDCFRCRRQAGGALRLLLGGLTLACLVAGLVLMIRWKRPHWLDRESVDAVALQKLQTTELAVSPAAAAKEWPQWFGPGRDGRAPEGPFRTDWKAVPPEILWTTPCGGGYSSLVLVENRLYTLDRLGDQERIVCLQADSGQPLWVHEYPVDYAAAGISYDAGPRATPLWYKHRLYCLGATGIFHCLLVQGDSPPEVIWKHDLKSAFAAEIPTWGLACSPLAEGGLILLQAGGKLGTLAAFDADTGELRWTAGNDPIGYSSPVAVTAAGVRQIVAVSGTSVLGVDPTGGRILWSHPWRTDHYGNIATPLVIGNYVFLSSNYGKGCMLLELHSGDPETRPGQVDARVVYFRKGRVMMNHHSTSVYHDGHLYGYDNNTLRCVNLREGEVVEHWIARDDREQALEKGCLILAGKHLVGLTQRGTVFLAEADPHEFRFRGQREKVLDGSKSDCWALPILVAGRLYLRDHQKVVCLDLRDASAQREASE